MRHKISAHSLHGTRCGKACGILIITHNRRVVTGFDGFFSGSTYKTDLKPTMRLKRGEKVRKTLFINCSDCRGAGCRFAASLQKRQQAEFIIMLLIYPAFHGIINCKLPYANCRLYSRQPYFRLKNPGGYQWIIPQQKPKEETG